MDFTERIIKSRDDNIDELRTGYPDGLHFVVGDTHGQVSTLKALMQKIKFDSSKDHIYFVGDYNEGGDVRVLMEYMALYYSADFNVPGFHMIRGNHERELCPVYTLENLPDIIVLRKKQMNYYIAHAGMMSSAFDIINEDMAKHPESDIFAYKFDDICVCQDAPLRQITWSKNGLYSQTSHYRSWPSEQSLTENRACIIHGHSPYCFFKHEDHFSYGDRNLYWENQHVYFSEDLQSFNIDANIKGRFANGEAFRSLSCICLECIEEIAKENMGYLEIDSVKNASNFVFSSEFVYGLPPFLGADISKILNAKPTAKRITLDDNNKPIVVT